MKKLMFGSLVVVVMLLGVLGQVRDLNASSTLSMEEMGKIEAGWCWWGSKCKAGGSCGTGTSCVTIGSGGRKCTVRNGGSYNVCKGRFFTCSKCKNSRTTTCGTVLLYNEEGKVETSWPLTHKSC